MIGMVTPAKPAVCESKASKVVDACEKNWPFWKADCSGFVKAVAHELGVCLVGDANAIVSGLTRPPWESIDPWWSVASGVDAADWAEGGYLVIAGKQAPGNGHLVVVVPGPLAHGKYPTAYWGKLHSIGKKVTTLNYAWTANDLGTVNYWATFISGTGMRLELDA